MTSEHHTPKFALVEWVNGEDKGKFSIVASSWLKGFDMKNYLSNKGETLVVEWRDQKKPPLGGWPCFDALVINISDSKYILEKEISSLVSLVSPTTLKSRPTEKQRPNSETAAYPELMDIINDVIDDSDNDKTYEPSPRGLKRAEKEDTSITTPKYKKNANKHSEGKLTVCKTIFGSEPISRPGPSSKSDPQSNCNRELQMLRKENAELKKRLLEEIPAMMKKMDDVINSRTSPSNNNAVLNETNPQQPQNGRVEILAGSGVFVDLEAWLSAKGCTTPGAFVGRLLINLFDNDVLLNSNLKGGASKHFPNAEKKNKLDQRKISALRGAMQSFFPEVKESQFGVFVNQKITNLRSMQKKTATT